MARGRKRILLAVGLIAISAVMSAAIILSKSQTFHIRYETANFGFGMTLNEGYVVARGGPSYWTAEKRWRFEIWPAIPPSSIVLAYPHEYAERKHGPQGPISLHTQPRVTTSLGPFGEYWTESPNWSLYMITWPFPLLVFGISLVPLISGLRAFRRRPGHCVKCRYDLRATAHGAPCPECGAKGSASTQA